ncbi:MAG: gamma-glutamyl-gamma-aminobutyrate hydrolase family protein [bacterium]|nr:gamma-glutamyl-gamma-aminobutyrate hydrolase family protein [bacterium]
MAPTVGIPLCLDAIGRWRAGRVYQYIDTKYARAVEAAGGVPVYLPLQSDATRLIQQVDALLLPGGDDFPPPEPYPEGVEFELVPPEQLVFDRELLGVALERGIPVLGICYGMQLIALHYGGSLHYDLSTDRPSANEHRLEETSGRHEVKLVGGSRLASVLGVPHVQANSLHHQAVAELGTKLRACGHTEDGVIEAIERDTGFCIGVQWHPEKLPGAEEDALFRALVDAAS